MIRAINVDEDTPSIIFCQMQIALILMYYFMHRSHILFSLHVGHNAIILICINASGDRIVLLKQEEQTGERTRSWSDWSTINP